MSNVTNFVEAGQALTKNVADFCLKYSDEIRGATAFAVPTIAAWGYLTPWAAVPATIGSVALGICVAKNGTWSGIRAGASLTVMSGFLSMMVYNGLDSHNVPTAVSDKVNSICWDMTKPGRLEFDGKHYDIVFNSITDFDTRAVASAGAEPVTSKTHHASGNIKYQWHDFFTGQVVNRSQPFTTAERPGAWKKDSDTFMINGQNLMLACH